MANDELLKKIVDTCGEAIKGIPKEELTVSMCKTAVELNESLIDYVPTKYLSEILQGEEFVREIIKRKVRIASHETVLLEAAGCRVDTMKYVEAQVRPAAKMIMQQLSIDANGIADEYMEELEKNISKRRS